VYTTEKKKEKERKKKKKERRKKGKEKEKKKRKHVCLLAVSTFALSLDRRSPISHDDGEKKINI